MSDIFNSATLQITLTDDQLREFIKQKVQEKYPDLSVDSIIFHVETTEDCRGDIYSKGLTEVRIRLKVKSL